MLSLCCIIKIGSFQYWNKKCAKIRTKGAADHTEDRRPIGGKSPFSLLYIVWQAKETGNLRRRLGKSNSKRERAASARGQGKLEESKFMMYDKKEYAECFGMHIGLPQAER